MRGWNQFRAVVEGSGTQVDDAGPLVVIGVDSGKALRAGKNTRYRAAGLNVLAPNQFSADFKIANQHRLLDAKSAAAAGLAIGVMAGA